MKPDIKVLSVTDFPDGTSVMKIQMDSDMVDILLEYALADILKKSAEKILKDNENGESDAETS